MATMLASVSDDRTLVLWDINNQENITTLREGTLYRCGRLFSRMGSFLLHASWMACKAMGRRARQAEDSNPC